MLTTHQLFHLNSILSEVDETKKLNSIDKSEWMTSKSIKEGKENDYLDTIVKDVEEIKKKGIFPNLESVAYIHDYIEKETKESFK